MFYKPKVSILMVVYNGQLFVKDAISSIIKQEYKNWELIIINDASIDNTLSIIKEFKNKKIIVKSISRNIGAYKATMLGLSFCKSKYICFLDSDDLMHKKKLLEQVNFLEKENKFVAVFN